MFVLTAHALAERGGGGLLALRHSDLVSTELGGVDPVSWTGNSVGTQAISGGSAFGEVEHLRDQDLGVEDLKPEGV